MSGGANGQAVTFQLTLECPGDRHLDSLDLAIDATTLTQSQFSRGDITLKPSVDDHLVVTTSRLPCIKMPSRICVTVSSLPTFWVKDGDFIPVYSVTSSLLDLPARSLPPSDTADPSSSCLELASCVASSAFQLWITRQLRAAPRSICKV